MASSFLPAAQRVPEARVTSCFMPPSQPSDLDELTAKIVRDVKARVAGNQINDEVKESPGGAQRLR